MMKYKMILTLLLSCCGLRALAQTEFCSSRNTAYGEGEQLTFKVWYNAGRIWIGAGEATFTVNSEALNGRRALHITADGKTLKSYDWVYRVRDRYESWIDAATMMPMKFVRNVNEGGFKIYNNVVFNQAIGQAVSTSGMYPVPKCVQDVLSAIYFARNLDYSKMKEGSKIPFSMFLDDKVYNLYIRYLGKEKIETRYGTFNTIKIAPLLISGNTFSGGEKMVVWVSDDANHLPVRVDSPIQIGSIKVDLIGFDKLRNAATGLVSRK